MALGNVSIVPFTRTEVERLIDKKAYPDGKVVWSGTVLFEGKYNNSVSVPDDVDYVSLNGTKIVRGGSGQVSVNVSSPASAVMTSTITLSSTGTLSVPRCTVTGGGTYMASSFSTRVSVTGYHYI